MDEAPARESITLPLDRERHLRLEYEQLRDLGRPGVDGQPLVTDPLKLLGEMLRSEITVAGTGIAADVLAPGVPVREDATAKNPRTIHAVATTEANGCPIALNKAQPGESVTYGHIMWIPVNLWAIEVMAWAAMRHEDATLTQADTARLIKDAVENGRLTLGAIGVAVRAAFEVGGLGSASRKNAAAAPSN